MLNRYAPYFWLFSIFITGVILFLTESISFKDLFTDEAFINDWSSSISIILPILVLTLLLTYKSSFNKSVIEEIKHRLKDTDIFDGLTILFMQLLLIMVIIFIVLLVSYSAYLVIIEIF